MTSLRRTKPPRSPIFFSLNAYILLVWLLAASVVYFSGYETDLTVLDSSERQLLNRDDFALAKQQSFGFFDDISSKEWQLLQERVRLVYPNVKSPSLEAIRNEPVNANVFLQNHFEPEFNCRHERRIGRLGDGGKWVCDPHRVQQKKDCLVYSVGSNGELSFERGIIKQLGCEVHVFDRADYSKVATEAGAIFHKWGISNETSTDQKGRQYRGLVETMEELGHRGRPIDIFKIDCVSVMLCRSISIPMSWKRTHGELHRRAVNGIRTRAFSNRAWIFVKFSWKFIRIDWKANFRNFLFLRALHFSKTCSKTGILFSTRKLTFDIGTLDKLPSLLS